MFLKWNVGYYRPYLKGFGENHQSSLLALKQTSLLSLSCVGAPVHGIVLSSCQDVAWYQGTLKRGICQVLDANTTVALHMDPSSSSGLRLFWSSCMYMVTS